MNWIIVTAGAWGVLAIGLGAFAAHGFGDFLTGLGYPAEDVPRRLENLQTGARYQLHAASALLAIGLFGAGRPGLRLAAAALAGGVAVFSGCLYALSVAPDGFRWLGAVVPLGGLAMIGAWTLVAVVGLRPRAAHETNAGVAEMIRLEEALTHQQRLSQDLSEALAAARDEVDATRARLARLEPSVERLLEMQDSADAGHDERPPHY